MSIKEYKLRDICETSNPKAKLTFKSNGIPVLNISNFLGDNKFKFMSIDEYQNLKTYPRFGDIFVSRVGTIGEVFIKENNDNFYLSDNFIWITNIKNKIVLNKYLYYKLISINNVLKSMNSGSTQPLLVKSRVLNINICIPNIETQQQIIDIIEPFEKMLNKEKIYIDILNNCLIFISNYISTEDKIHFLSIVNFCGTKYRNQKKYIDT